MPSQSKTQQRLMGMAYAYKKGELDSKEASQEVKDLADSMTLKQLKKYAATKHEGLPDKVDDNLQPGDIGGMGPIKFPTATETGSGDVPAGQGDAEEEYEKKRRKMKHLKNFESFVNESLNEAAEILIFDADNIRRQLKKQNASDASIEKYIKINTEKAKPGEYYYQSVGNPGIGKVAYKITKVKNGNIWGVYDHDKSTVRILDPSDVI